MREDDVRQLPEFPAAALVWARLAESFGDSHLLDLMVEAQYFLQSDEVGDIYDISAVANLCDAVLSLPAGLIVSEFVPEAVRDQIGEVVTLASQIRGRMFFGGAVVDFDVFAGEVQRLLAVLSEILGLVVPEEQAMPPLDEVVRAVAEDCHRGWCW